MAKVYIRRSAETEAAYLLGRLRSGMRILDISCGLGSISVCLAAAVALGEFRGIDMDQSQIDVATSVDQEAGLSNALFQVADALDLPFPDDYFDARFIATQLLCTFPIRVQLSPRCTGY